MNNTLLPRTAKSSIAYLLSLCLLISCLSGCGHTVTSNEAPTPAPQIDAGEIAGTISEQIKERENDLDDFAYDRIVQEYSLAYDTFDAVIALPDGTEVHGLGYSDFACYFEPADGGKGFFPAGFLILDDADIKEYIEEGLEIENLDYSDENYGFVLAYNTEPYLEHCVVDGKYVQYGIDDTGKFVHSECDYSREACNEELGALYSYDSDRFLLDPDIGTYKPIAGEALFRDFDYNALEAEVNRILDEQDFNFSSVDVKTTAYFAKEAVTSYFLSLQEETFLGCDVKQLIEEVSKLDPLQCIRVTPNGNVIIDVENDIPREPDALAKWTVGISCGIAVAGSVALGVFVPAATPASGTICGAAIDVFMQVVIENHAVEDINWSKVAISATSGALMAWACPLGAGAITQSVAERTGSAALSKLAGYGFLTISNAVVSGSTNAAFTLIDNGSKSEVFDSFLVGAALGACCTVAASALGELGHAGMKALKCSHPENWFVKLTDGAAAFVGKHQVRLQSAKLESILAPKSIYEASQAGVREYNIQATMNAGKKGGSYSVVMQNSNGKYTQVHETPSFESTGAQVRKEGPSIKMTVDDHKMTASWGNSKEAQQYRAAQKALIEQGKYHEAIQMDIDDLYSKFGHKYDDAIDQMLEYAKQIGWW